MNEEQNRKIEFLNRAFYDNTKIKALEALRDRNTSILERYSKCTDASEVMQLQIANQNSVIKKEIEKMIKHRSEIQKVISGIKNDSNGTLRAILLMRYVSFMSMQEIADTIGYDRKTIQRKHKAALDCLDIK